MDQAAGIGRQMMWESVVRDSMAFFPQVAKKLSSTSCAPAPDHARFPPETLRLRTAGRIACSAGRLVALGEADAQVLLDLERLEQQKALTADQLLALAAEKSEAVAAALGARYAAEGKLNEQVVEQLRQEVERQRDSNRDHATQLERVLDKALQQMGNVASAKAESQGPGDQTIVTGGAGSPTVINPKQPDGPREKE